MTDIDEATTFPPEKDRAKHMRRHFVSVVATLATLLINAAFAAGPTAPFTSDASTLVLLHFDGNLNDSGPLGYNGTMSAISGATSTPSYTAGQSAFGQCLTGNGAALQNGVMITNTALSQLTTTPLTVEGWVKIPASASTVEMNQYIINLGAGRFDFRLRNANTGSDTNKYLYLDSYVPGSSGLTPQYAYCVIPAASWSYDAWHHVAVTYDVTAGLGNAVQFYFDGSKVAKGSDNITTFFDSIPFGVTTAGNVISPPSPTSNNAPLNGSIDEVRVSSVLRYGAGNQLLNLQFENNYADSSPYGWTTTLSSIGGYANPTYTAGRTGSGQAWTGNGPATGMNGLTLDPGLSQIPNTPLTAEAWIKAPTGYEDTEFTNYVLSLAANKFNFMVRFAGAGDSNVYPQLDVFNGTSFESNYAVVNPTTTGFTYGTWHHFAVTYNPGGSPAVAFFMDGAALPMYPNGTAITSQFQRTAEPGLAAGRVWPPSAPTSNLNNLTGQIDDIRLTKGILYGTGDPNVLLNVKLDGTYEDASAYARPVSLTSLAGHTNPTFVADAGFGQAIMAAGSTVNGVRVTDTAISQITSPMTVDWRFYFPTTALNQEFTNCIMDLGGSRFLLTLRHGSDNYFYPQLQIIRGPSDNIVEWTYAAILPADATLGAWHDYRMVYDLTASTKVRFYFDGKLLTSNASAPVSGEFNKVAEYGVLAGRVWPPAAPTSNAMPLNGTIDEIKISKGSVLPPDLSTTVSASRATITVDGSAADWASLASGIVALNTGGHGQLTCNVRYAWDPTYLYILVQETAGDTVKSEAPSNVDYVTTGPWSYDGVAFWTDFDLNFTGEAIGDFNPWFGLSSSTRTDLFTARINNSTALTASPMASATVRTSGNITGNNRVIEARIAWSDLAFAVDASRQPGGNLSSAIAAGYKFGCQPLLIDNDWSGQAFIGGAQNTIPSGTDVNSRTVQLLPAASAVNEWSIY